MTVYFIKLLGKLPVGEESYANEESNAQDMDINEITDKIRKRNSKHDGLLEGISDEELDDVSDEENGDKNSQKGQSAKLADALGVDWSQLSELKQKQKNLSNEENETDEKQAQAEIRRKRWTPIAIFNRIGIPKSFLSEEFYQSFVKQLNDNAQGRSKNLHSMTVHFTRIIFYKNIYKYISLFLNLRWRKVRVITRKRWYSHANEAKARKKKKFVYNWTIFSTYAGKARNRNQVKFFVTSFVVRL